MLAIFHIKLLQAPLVQKDGEPVSFPYKKAEALFYYLSVVKNATRDELSILLWEEDDKDTARKNLRHALYVIKKSIGTDIIASPSQNQLILQLGEGSDVDTDLLENADISVYAGAFLQGFSVKDADNFDAWMQKSRENYRERYLAGLYESIVTLSGDLAETERLCSRYISEDPYDERIVVHLMDCYRRNRLYHKGVKAYQRLSDVLGEELGIAPGKETSDAYHALLSDWSDYAAQNSPPQDSIRRIQAEMLDNAYRSLTEGIGGFYLIQGESGVGKSHLVQRFLDSLPPEECLILKTTCYESERAFPLSCWNGIMLQLERFIVENNIEVPGPCLQAVASLFPTFGSAIAAMEPVDDIAQQNLRAVQNGLLKLFDSVSRVRPLVLFLDNISWMDAQSLDLLSLLVLKSDAPMLILCACLDTVDAHLSSFVSALAKANALHLIPLKRFTREETENFIRLNLAGTAYPLAKTVDFIYRQTQGNAFFLTEFLNNYREKDIPHFFSVGAQNILYDRLSGLSQEARQLLDILSLFHDAATLDVIERILPQSEDDLLALLDELKLHSLIQESMEDYTICFRFTHDRMREFVSGQLAASKRRVLHQRIAAALEDLDPPPSGEWYNLLIHHHTQAQNRAKALYYRVLSLETYMGLSFELYPVLGAEVGSEVLPKSNVMDYFAQLETELARLKQTRRDKSSFDELEIQLFHAKGRYCIFEGLYSEGIASIRHITSSAYARQNPLYMLKAYRLMIYYGIQLNEKEIMRTHIEQGLRLSEQIGEQAEYLSFLRFAGLLAIMDKQFELARNLLFQAEEGFEAEDLGHSVYILNTAACENYLGELERVCGNLSKACERYEIAISLCRDNGIVESATFVTNLACAQRSMGLIEKADRSFLRACELYDNSPTLMGRSVAMGFCAVYYAKKGDMPKSLEHLKLAGTASNQLGSPIEKGLLRRTQAQLLSEYPDVFSSELTESLDFYCDECERLLASSDRDEIKDVALYRKE